VIDNPNLRYKINKVLAEWNPIGVPELIAEEEYISFVNQIITIGNDSHLLKKFLISITDDMGLDFNEHNEGHMDSINVVVKKIIDILKNI